MQQNKLGGIEFNCEKHYQIIKLIGSGAFSTVVLAYDLKNNSRKVAIKKLNLIEDVTDAKRILREILIQRQMDHQNILKIYDILYDSQNFDIYIVSQYFPTDLGKVIASRQQLTVEHVQFIMYQLCKGLHYLHSSNSIHRDIKPRNILVNEKCEVCYCDFGLSRKIDENQEQQGLENITEYVVTRYYRAPEIMLSNSHYSKPIDIWALGCTFAELMSRQVLFDAPNYLQLIKIIFDKLGKPQVEELKTFVTKVNALEYIQKLPSKTPQPASKSIPYVDSKARDLLDKMLQIVPSNRITIQQCLEHPFFQTIRNKDQEIIFNGIIECDFEKDENISLIQIFNLIFEEINKVKMINKEQTINPIQEIQKLRLKKKFNN